MLDRAFWALCEPTPPPSREHLHLEFLFFHPPDFFCSCAFAPPSSSSGAPSPLLCWVNPLTHLLIPAQRVPFPKALSFSWWCPITSLLFVSLFFFPHRQFLRSGSIPGSCPGPGMQGPGGTVNGWPVAIHMCSAAMTENHSSLPLASSACAFTWLPLA